MLEILYTHAGPRDYLVITFEPLSGYVTCVAGWHKRKEWVRMAQTYSYHPAAFPDSAAYYVSRFREHVEKTIWVPAHIWTDAENALYLHWRRHKRAQ